MKSKTKRDFSCKYFETKLFVCDRSSEISHHAKRVALVPRQKAAKGTGFKLTDTGVRHKEHNTSAALKCSRLTSLEALIARCGRFEQGLN